PLHTNLVLHTSSHLTLHYHEMHRPPPTATLLPYTTLFRSGVKARLAELGTPTEGTPETPDVAEQRKELTKNTSTLDAQMKLARLIAVEAGQASEQILKLRRTQFQAQLGRRTSSIAAPTFWKDLLAEWPQDLGRLEPLREQLTTLFRTTAAGIHAIALVAILLVIGLRIRAGRALIQMSIT